MLGFFLPMNFLVNCQAFAFLHSSINDSSLRVNLSLPLKCIETDHLDLCLSLLLLTEKNKFLVVFSQYLGDV